MVKDKNIVSVDIVPSTRKDKKFMGIFKNKENKNIKKIHFGASGYRDYTLLSDKNSDFYIEDVNKRNEVKTLYINRHKKRENWEQPDNGGAMSRFILWNKPTLNESIEDYKKRFKIK